MHSQTQRSCHEDEMLFRGLRNHRVSGFRIRASCAGRCCGKPVFRKTKLCGANLDRSPSLRGRRHCRRFRQPRFVFLRRFSLRPRNHARHSGFPAVGPSKQREPTGLGHLRGSFTIAVPFGSRGGSRPVAQHGSSGILRGRTHGFCCRGRRERWSVRKLEGVARKMKSRRTACIPFAFFASTPLRSLRFPLALPLRIPCAVARQDAAPPRCRPHPSRSPSASLGGAASGRARSLSRPRPQGAPQLVTCHFSLVARAAGAARLNLTCFRNA